MSKTLKRGWNRKEGRENKSFKTRGGGKLSEWVGALKKGGGLNPLRNNVLQHLFLNKGKINTSQFFSMLHDEESPEKPQYNMATPPFLEKPPILPNPPFSSKNFQTLPFPSILKKSNPPFYEWGGWGGRGSNYVYS